MILSLERKVPVDKLRAIKLFAVLLRRSRSQQRLTISIWLHL
jgi:hypothetical protein